MGRVLFIFFFGIHFQASAQKLQWEQFFSSTPVGVFSNFSQLKSSQFQKWIKGYDSCSAEVDLMVELMDQYDQSFRSGEEINSKQTYQKISGLMSVGGSCFNPLWTTYLAKSLSLGPKITKDKLPRVLTDEKVLVAILLANKNHILPLTPVTRKKLAKENHSPLWIEKKEGDYLISGFYDCLRSTIYISSDLKPFNISASFSHELDHLYRDKGGYVHFLNNPNNPDKSMTTYIVADELIATIYGGFHQRNIIASDAHSNFDYTHHGGEFNFFEIKGPLDRFFNLLSMISFPWNFNEFFYGFLKGGAEGQISGIKSDQILPLLCEMNETIVEGYFEDATYTCNKNSAFPKAAYFTLESNLSSHRQFRNAKDLEALLDQYQGWLNSMNQPSKICRMIIEAGKKGEFKDYIGNKLMVGGHGGNGGIRPCLRVNF